MTTCVGRYGAAAVADAAGVGVVDGVGLTSDGTAVTAEGFTERVEGVKSGGKCWSVDEQRSTMGDLKA